MKTNMLFKSLSILFCLLLFPAHASFAQIHNDPVSFLLLHADCFSERWKYVASDGYDNYFKTNAVYDKETVEEINHFNPFGDRIVKMWIATHTEQHATYKYFYEINLDNKTIKVLSAPSPKYKYLNKERPVTADSLDECIFLEAERLYSD